MWTIQSKNSKNYLHWRAFTKQELLKDKTIENSQTVLKQLSKTYSINFLTARGFNGFKNFRFFPEVLYKSKFGQHFLRMNNLSSKIFNKIGLNVRLGGSYGILVNSQNKYVSVALDNIQQSTMRKSIINLAASTTISYQLKKCNVFIEPNYRLNISNSFNNSVVIQKYTAFGVNIGLSFDF